MVIEATYSLDILKWDRLHGVREPVSMRIAGPMKQIARRYDKFTIASALGSAIA